jgi:lysophospholipase L1-like esterase
MQNCHWRPRVKTGWSSWGIRSQKVGFIYLDYFSSMADKRNGLKSEYSEDGVHPNKAGYLVMEGLLEKVLGTIFE